MDNHTTIRNAWHFVFDTDQVPNSDARDILLSESGLDVEIVLQAIEACSRKKHIVSFESRFAYVRGIIRNKRGKS